MKPITTVIAMAFMASAPVVVHAQTAPATSQDPLNSSSAEAAPNQAIKPLTGDIIYDKVGEQIGAVSGTNDQQVIVTTERGKITIPVTSLFNGTKGLAINMTKGEVDAAIQSAH